MKKNSLFYSWKDFTQLQIAFFSVIFGIYCYFRFQYRFRSEFLSDELYTISGFQHSFAHYLFHYLPKGEFHYPVDFLLMYPIGHWITTNRFVLMIPHMIAMFVFYFFFIKINWQKVLDLSFKFPDPKWINVIAAAMIAYNETQILHALILRPYAVLSLLTLLALTLAYYSFHAIQFKAKLSWAIFAFIIFHNYCLLMLLLGIFYISVTMLRKIKMKEVIRFLVSHVHSFQIIGFGMLLALPVLIYFHQAPALQPEYLANSQIDTHQYIKPGLKGFIQVVAIYYGFKPMRILLLCLGLMGTLFLIIQKKWKPIFFLFVWVILPTFMIYVADVRMKYWFIQRQFLWAMPFHAVYIAGTALYAISQINHYRRRVL